MAERETPATDRVRVEVWSRSIWQVVGAVLITVTLIWLVFQARSLVGMLVVSFFFSLALQPAVNSLHRRYGWRRGAAVGVIYLAGAVLVIVMILVLIPATRDG